MNNIASSAQESSFASAGRGKGKGGKGYSDSEDDTLVKRSQDNTAARGDRVSSKVEDDVEMKSESGAAA